MNEVLYALILGIVQGISEFLPISSSGHLILTSNFFTGHALPMELNIGLHFGTLLAVLFYFKEDWFFLFKNLFFIQKPADKQAKHTFLYLVVGSIPAALIGLTFKHQIENYFHNPRAMITPLILIGVLLWLADRFTQQQRSWSEMGLMDAFMIGLAQALALIPGVSRSGSTIMMGRSLGLTRATAAKYSFMLGTLAMGGAALLEIKSILVYSNSLNFWLSLITSCLVGSLTIHFLLTKIQKISFIYFAIYRCFIAFLIFWFIK